MRSLQALGDKAAINLSLLCAIHCLVFPWLLVWLPSIAALQLDGEAFHLWMLFLVIPISIYALTTGCRQHKRYRLLAVGIVGILFLVLAVALGEGIGEVWEKTLTLIGATIITLGHYWNYSLCQNQDRCACPEPSANTQ